MFVMCEVGSYLELYLPWNIVQFGPFSLQTRVIIILS